MVPRGRTVSRGRTSVFVLNPMVSRGRTSVFLVESNGIQGPHFRFLVESNGIQGLPFESRASPSQGTATAEETPSQSKGKQSQAKHKQKQKQKKSKAKPRQAKPRKARPGQPNQGKRSQASSKCGGPPSSPGRAQAKTSGFFLESNGIQGPHFCFFFLESHGAEAALPFFVAGSHGFQGQHTHTMTIYRMIHPWSSDTHQTMLPLLALAIHLHFLYVLFLSLFPFASSASMHYSDAFTYLIINLFNYCSTLGLWIQL